MTSLKCASVPAQFTIVEVSKCGLKLNRATNRARSCQAPSLPISTRCAAASDLTTTRTPRIIHTAAVVSLDSSPATPTKLFASSSV